MNTNGEGVAVCRCGSELHITCSGGCAEPDVVFEDSIATLCNVPGCTDAVAKRAPGDKGPPRRRCPTHYEKTREYERNRKAAKAARESQ